MPLANKYTTHFNWSCFRNKYSMSFKYKHPYSLSTENIFLKYEKKKNFVYKYKKLTHTFLHNLTTINIVLQIFLQMSWVAPKQQVVLLSPPKRARSSSYLWNDSILFFDTKLNWWAANRWSPSWCPDGQKRRMLKCPSCVSSNAQH